MYIDPTQPESCFVFRSVKKKQKMSFNFFINFWHSVDENGSMTCSAINDKFSILCYFFNSKKLDLDYLLSLLNAFAREQRLDNDLIDSVGNCLLK